MFRSFAKSRNVVTLFHSPSSAVSKQILSVLSKNKETTAAKVFDLEVIEAPPTKDQLRALRSYTTSAGGGADTFVAASGADVVRPMVVDWLNGRAVVGDDLPGVQALVEELKKD
ncbi:thioredoxin-like protein [Dipodascopsis tothii]|uniref:thioredoxin-like protein n=1 Tax=Dipodascopsis tothii TaxID=44089 RepID=UPI0034CFB086